MMKCGFCKRTISKLKFSLTTGDAGSVGYRCVAFTCPHCFSVLSAQIDPHILNQELLAEIKKLRSGG